MSRFHEDCCGFSEIIVESASRTSFRSTRSPINNCDSSDFELSGLFMALCLGAKPTVPFQSHTSLTELGENDCTEPQTMKASGFSGKYQSQGTSGYKASQSFEAFPIPAVTHSSNSTIQSGQLETRPSSTSKSHYGFQTSTDF